MALVHPEIIFGAATSHERLNWAGGLAQPSPGGRVKAGHLVEQWCGIFNTLETTSAEAALERRFQLGGRTRAKVTDALARSADAAGAVPSELATWCADAAVPEWVWLVAPIVEAIRVRGDDGAGFPGHVAPLEEARPLPFEDLLIGVVRLGAERVAAGLDHARVGGLSERIGAEGERALYRQLLVLLTDRCELVLYHEFQAVLPFGQRVAAGVAEPGEIEKPSQAGYDEFVMERRADGCRGLFRKYPVLARTLALTLANWIRSTIAFVERLEGDWELLPGLLDAPGNAGQVSEIATGLSDPHDGGQSVFCLTLQNGERLLYKPRDLELDAALRGVLVDFSDNLDCELIVAAVVARDGYGWVQYIQQVTIDASDEAGIEAFYEQSGTLLFILYLLGGTDFHHGNVVANNGRLVPIDLESLMLAEPTGAWLEAEDSNEGFQLGRGFDTVLKTGLLPNLNVRQDGSVLPDNSGLGARAALDTKLFRRTWIYPNTDFMSPRQLEVRDAPEGNEPVSAGIEFQPLDYLDSVLTGFERAYRKVIANRAHWADSENGPLAALSRATVRFILRPTQIYFDHAAASLTPDRMRCGFAYSLHFERLARVIAEADDRRGFGGLILSEIHQMLQLDVPRFELAAGADEMRVPTGDGVQTVPFYTSGLTAVFARLSDLGDTDLARQTGLIRMAYGGVTGAAYRPRKPFRSPTTRKRPDHAFALTDAALVEEAEAIAETVRCQALYRFGAAHWIGHRQFRETEYMSVQRLGLELYEGRSGIALFLAVLANIAHREENHALWRSALKPARDVAEGRAGLDQAAPGLSLAHGIAGLIYTCATIADFAERDDRDWLLETARLATCWIDEAKIAQMKQFDLMGGTAGVILGCLAYYERWGDPVALNRAEIAAEHLKATFRRKLAAAPCDVSSDDEAPLLTGLSHGAAGVAFALSRLEAFAPAADTMDCIAEALAFENRHFDRAARNWHDLRQGARGAFMTSWCHGAPGIALSRASLLNGGIGGVVCPCHGTIESDLEAAADTTRSAGLLGLDHLCCGNLGLADVLLTVGRARQEPAMLVRAREIALETVQRAHRNGCYRLFNSAVPGIEAPGLFRGLSGVGYQLLRTARPDLVPSVVSFAVREGQGIRQLSSPQEFKAARCEGRTTEGEGDVDTECQGIHQKGVL